MVKEQEGYALLGIREYVINSIYTPLFNQKYTKWFTDVQYKNVPLFLTKQSFIQQFITTRMRTETIVLPPTYTQLINYKRITTLKVSLCPVKKHKTIMQEQGEHSLNKD